MSMPDHDTLAERLIHGIKCAPQDVIIVDDDPWSATRIFALSDQLAKDLGRECRIACMAQNPAIIAATLIAAGRQGHDVLLVRDPSSLTENILSRLGVAATIDDQCQLVSRKSDRQSGQGRVLFMTSGTTGAPKLASHRRGALMDRISMPSAADPDARWLLTYHPASFAGLQVFLTSLASGTTLVATVQTGIVALVAAAKKHNITFASGTPTFWRGFLTACGEDARAIHLRIITLGGEMVDQPTLDRLRAMWPSAKLTHIYASTEGGAVFAVKDGRIGFPAEWLEKGVDQYCLRLSNGMLEIKGPRMMESYEETDMPSPLADGWLKTGDLCILAGDRVVFAGRQDTVINVGGAKVSPEAIETPLMRLPIVHDARVFGKPNPITGMLVVAEIVLADHSLDPIAARKAVLDYARTVLKPYEVPQSLIIVPNVAVTSSAKKARQ